MRVGSEVNGVPYTHFEAANFPFFLLPSPYPTTLGICGLTTNVTRCMMFYLPMGFSVHEVNFRVSAASAGTFVSVGFYQMEGGNLIFSSGAVSAATTGVKTITLSPLVSLPPGFYWYAWTGNSNAHDMNGISAPANLNAILNNVDAQLGFSSNASVGGLVPSNIGTVTAQDINPAVVKLC